ncbi:hypothetical protein C8R44DRAFT_867898 [Mycena epipterygia]|nr:hypothetical protein C8R44DRAFT_867898 [Mycena epipterygia]
MPKSSKRKREESSEEEEEEEETFTVEVITKARVGAAVDADDPWEYRVKWAGYESNDDTWEPATCMAGCQRLLHSFWEEIGGDDKDYPQGTVVKPSDKWIKKERKRFKTDYSKGKDENRKQKERADRRKEETFEAKKAAKKRKQSLAKETAPLPSRSASSFTTHTSVPSTSALPKKKAKIMLSDSSDSDDDKPLANLKKRKISPKAGDAKPPAKMQRTDTKDKDKRSASTSSVPKNGESINKGTKSAPPSRPRTPPAVASLFSPSPPSSPEITLSSLPTITSKPKPKLTGKASTSSVGPGRPSLPAINTAKHAPSPTLPSTTPKPISLPKPSVPLPNRQRTSNSNVGSATSSTFPSRPFSKTTSAMPSTSKPATPTIPSASKPATAAISSASKGATPTIPSANKPVTPTILASAIPHHIQRKGSASSRGTQSNNLSVPPAMSSGSGLSTKQRLAQGALALAPTNKEATKKNNLSGLSFKKTASTGSAPPVASGSTSRPKNLPRPKRPTIDPLFDADPDEEPFELFDSPVEWDESFLTPALSRRPSQANVQASQANVQVSPANIQASHANVQASQAKVQANIQAAEDLLKDMMPAKLAAPLTAAMDKPDGPHPPRPLGFKPKMPPPPKIPKKWKWTGKLLMEVKGKTDHLCDIVLNELVPPQPEGLRINLTMASVESIHLLSFHDLMDMSDFLKTCVRIHSSEPSQQLARLGPNSDKDVEPLKILARYMTKKNYVSLVPAFLDNHLVGHLLLFPPNHGILIRMFRVPHELASSSSLVAALLPWKVFPEESRRPFDLLPSTKLPVISPTDWKKTMLKHKYQLALRVLKFPAPLHEWMSKSNRPYCIWPPSGDQKGARDRETGYLMSILTQCGAKRVGFKADIRAIFVHVGALKHVQKMPLLVDRRSGTCSVRFHTYGTHETVHPEYWGVREIYPFGGVVTFTPKALYEDPWGVINRMKAIDKHPLWTCYLLPSVLGMAAKLSNPEEDPLSAFDRGVFVFELLLRAIDDGEVSVLRAPPLDRNPSLNSDPTTEWLRDHWIARPVGQRRVLEFCIGVFSAKYSNVPQAQWASAVETEISEDLNLMQMQPDIMKHYRRYVVIRAEDDVVSADKDGFEWVTNSNFSFNDDSPTQKVVL